MKEIQLREAKATLSAVVDEAVRGEPCVITRHRRREAVLIAYEEWEKLSRVPSFGRLLMDLPRLRGHPAKHDSAVGVDDGETRAGQAADVFG
jgi:antitoxin Phd